jgi:site-specific recombinase XerD
MLNIKCKPEYISKKFKKAVRETKLNDRIHLHSLRHSFCSGLVSKNISLYKRSQSALGLLIRITYE